METVEILLATYNGEQFLRLQLDSIFAQSYKTFRLIIRDDGSTDATLAIIKEYQNLYPDKIYLFRDENKQVGAIQNFSLLLQNSEADYIFLCDQDDIWHENKMSLSLQKIKSMESAQPQLPILVHHDMEVIDESNEWLHASKWTLENNNPKHNKLQYLLGSNHVQGCTVLINKALRQQLLPIPKEAVMHDHWLALLAVSIGKIGYLPEALGKYRIHAQNVTGQTRNEKKRSFTSNKNINKLYSSLFLQASAFLQQYRQLLSDSATNLIQNFLNLQTAGFLKRKYLIIANSLYRPTWPKTLFFILRF